MLKSRCAPASLLVYGASLWGPTQLLHRAKRRRARARAGRHAAGSCIEVGGVGGLHRACTMQRHAGALINGARSSRHLGGADRAADRRSGARAPVAARWWSLLPPPAVVESCARPRRGPDRHTGADLRRRLRPPPVPRIGRAIGKRHRAGVTGSGWAQGVCALDGGHRGFPHRDGGVAIGAFCPAASHHLPSVLPDSLWAVAVRQRRPLSGAVRRHH